MPALVTEITKNGLIRSQTQREMYESLHARVEDWRSDRAFMCRMTEHAKTALARWVDEGVLETRETQIQPRWGMPYMQTEYRLAPPWRDATLVDADLMARNQSLRAQEERADAEVVRAETNVVTAWTELRAVALTIVALGEEPPTPELQVAQGEDAARAGSQARWAQTSRESALTHRERLREYRAELDAQFARHARGEIAPPPDVAADGDPLGGDA